MSQRRDLQTGQYIAGCRTHGSYVRAEREDSLLRVFVGVPTMSQADLDRFRSGDIRFTAAVLDECLFFLFRFGDAPWIAAPFAPDGNDVPPERMTFVFVDSDSGVAQEIRSLDLSEEASGFYFEKCSESLRLSCEHTERLKRQSAVFRKYLTGEAMMRTAESVPVFCLTKYIKN